MPFLFIIILSFEPLARSAKAMRSSCEIFFGKGWMKEKTWIWLVGRLLGSRWVGRAREGLEICNIRTCNKALLANGFCLFHFESDSLWNMIIVSKHDPDTYISCWVRLKAPSGVFGRISLLSSFLFPPCLLWGWGRSIGVG